MKSDRTRWERPSSFSMFHESIHKGSRSILDAFLSGDSDLAMLPFLHINLCAKGQCTGTRSGPAPSAMVGLRSTER